jgi:segregation and condensation protein A
VHLTVFEGPFDLLLGLIARHRLDVTEVALSQVTDEFVAYVRALRPEVGLERTSEFLVVAATLLDLKTARLLPSGRVDDEEDLAALEARDLLFARLVQYRAFRTAAASFAVLMEEAALRVPRAVRLEERFRSVLPDVVLDAGAEDLAALATRVLAPRPAPVVPTEHLHDPAVSVRAQAAILVPRLRALRRASFRALTSDCPDALHVVGRFLALLQPYGARAVTFDQLVPLGDLFVRWVGPDSGELDVGGEFDDRPRAGENGAGIGAIDGEAT